MKPIVSALAYLVARTTSVLALLVAGPHAGLLPGWAEPVVLG